MAAVAAAAAASTKHTLPPFPSLPLDTDLKTMLDYNSHKHVNSAAATVVNSKSQMSVEKFTKPNVPATNDGHSKRAAGSHQSSSSFTTVPLNASGALEDMEKKFKMSDEMRAVVQKVLSNPDLSTFIQTTSSSGGNTNSSVPLSPPISPAIGGNQPNVTITPQYPANYVGGSRQKSVICSTNAAANIMCVPPSPSSTNSTASPSPTRPSSRTGLKYHNSNGSTSISFSPLTSSPSSSSSSSSHKLHQQLQLQLQQFNMRHNQKQPQQQQRQEQLNTPIMEVIDLSSPRRSMHTANSAAYLQQHQQQQQQQQQQQHQAAAVAAHQQQHQQQQHQHRLSGGHHSQSNGNNGNVNGNNGSNSSGNTHHRSTNNSQSVSAANSASLHLQRHAAMAANAAAAVASEGNRLCIIPEIPVNNINVPPYKVQKVYVDNHLVPCINMKAFNDCDQLMTLTDFRKYFFPLVSLEHCKRLIEALGVELYKGNRRQLQLLIENDRNHNENIPLVQVRDVMKYMTQLTFMIRSQDQQPPSKRVRVS